MQLKSFLKKINELLLEICWSHWRRLGAYSTGPLNQCSTDPEALILMTCFLGRKEERLLEVMGQWIRYYGNLIPIDRFKSLLDKTFQEKSPHDHMVVLNAALNAALPEGEKKKWKPIFQIIESEPKKTSLKFEFPRIESRKKIDLHEKILHKNRQMALRYLFGPGSRADICYLISILSQQNPSSFHFKISAAQFAKRLHYNRTSIHRIFVDLVEGLFLQKKMENPTGEVSNYQLNQNCWFIRLDKKFDIHYVDWFQIAMMARQWTEFEKSLARIEIKYPEENPIIKVWLQQTGEVLQQLAHAAFIPLKFKALPNVELEGVSLNQIIKDIEKILESTHRYLTGP